MRTDPLLKRAAAVTPGGVNTSIRRLPDPLVFTGARGQTIIDADGKEYIDFHLAFGCQVLGHCDEYVDRRVLEAMRSIDLIGAGATELEVQAAEKLLEHVAYADQVLFCLTGSEATHTALRFARSATGRRKIVKFQGCYHGWHDAVLANVITPPEMVGRVSAMSSGMVPDSLSHTLVCEFNDVMGLERAFQEHGDDIAAVILEPIPHNVGCLLPTTSFLNAARLLCDRHGSVLIFDEVVTGFRHSLNGFGKIAGVEPDLTAFGKALGNGYPVAAVCGRASVMAESATAGGPAFFAGTYNGHPIGMAAMIATIERLESGEVYEHIFALGERMRAGLKWAAEDIPLPTFSTGFGSLFVLYFLQGPVSDYRDLLANDAARFVRFQQGMTQDGFFMLPINLKRSQVSAAHTQADVDRAVEAAARVLRSVSDQVATEVVG
jgi:glutamate-1-semialdehyde 2,1-aminomutase